MLDKKKIIKSFAKSEKDVGSMEVQIGIATGRIEQIAQHLKSFPKDEHSRMGLLKLVGKKRRLVKYLKNNDKASYEKIIKQLSK